MDRDKEERLQHGLLEGETIEWSGEPKPSAVFTAWDIFLIPFSLLWCGFVVFWESFVIIKGVPFFWIFGLFFVAVGFYIVFGRFIVKYRNSKNTAYAITNRRILVTGKRSVSALDLKDVPLIHKTEQRNGSGSLDFERSEKRLVSWNTGLDIWGFSQKNHMKFTGIENVKEVYVLVSEKVHAAKNLP